MPGPLIKNPFSLAYDQILSALKGWAPLTALVLPTNFENLDRADYKPRDNAGAADRARMRILEKQIQAKPLSLDSNQVSLVCRYPFEITSGQLGVLKLNIIAITCIQALANAGPFLGLQQTDAIRKWEWMDANITPFDPMTKRPDWTLVGGVLVEFAMRRETFLSVNFD